MYSQVWKTMLYKLLSAWVSMFQVSSCFRSESWALPKAVTSHHWSKAFQLEFWGASKPAHGSLFNTDTNIRTLEKKFKELKEVFSWLLASQRSHNWDCQKRRVRKSPHDELLIEHKLRLSSWIWQVFIGWEMWPWKNYPQKKQHGNGKSPIFIRRYIFIHGWFSIVIRSFSGKRGSWTWQFTWRCKKNHASGLSLECYMSLPKTWHFQQRYSLMFDVGTDQQLVKKRSQNKGSRIEKPFNWGHYTTQPKKCSFRTNPSKYPHWFAACLIPPKMGPIQWPMI